MEDTPDRLSFRRPRATPPGLFFEFPCAIQSEHLTPVKFDQLLIASSAQFHYSVEHHLFLAKIVRPSEGDVALL
jgi:hypothetical protein